VHLQKNKRLPIKLLVGDCTLKPTWLCRYSNTEKLKYTFPSIAIGGKMAGNSYSKLQLGFAVMWLVMTPLWLISQGGFFLLYPVAAFIFLAVGILIGVAVGFFSERRILKIIEKKGLYGNSSFSRTLVVLLIVIGVLLVVPSIFSIVFFSVVFFNSAAAAQLSLIIQSAFLVIIPMLPTGLATQVFTIKRWEKKNQMQILYDSGLFTMKIYPAPPAPPFPPSKPEPI
jgi:hypothetical protein